MLQATASKCDNLVWQPSTCKIRFAKLRAQLLHTSALCTTFAPVPSPYVPSRKIDREPAPRPGHLPFTNKNHLSSSGLAPLAPQTCGPRAARKLAQIVAAKSSPACRRPRAISPTVSQLLTQPEATHKRRHRRELFHRDSRLPGVGLA